MSTSPLKSGSCLDLPRHSDFPEYVNELSNCLKCPFSIVIEKVEAPGG